MFYNSYFGWYKWDHKKSFEVFFLSGPAFSPLYQATKKDFFVAFLRQTKKLVLWVTLRVVTDLQTRS